MSRSGDEVTTVLGLAQEGDTLLAEAKWVRWAPPVAFDVSAELERRKHGSHRLLLALPGAIDRPGALQQMTRQAVRALAPGDGIELDGSPRPPSPWSPGPDPTELAIELAQAAQEARGAEVDVVWRMDPQQAHAENLEALRDRELLGERDSVLLDVRGLSRSRIEQILKRIDPVIGRARVWLSAGMQGRSRDDRTRELTSWQALRDLGVGRLYWAPLPGGSLHRLWGRVTVEEAGRMASRPGVVTSGSKPRVLVTGGAGFVGSNLVESLVRRGHEVVVLDDLHRAGTEHNLQWLRRTYGQDIRVVLGDVRCPDAVADALRDVDHVFHLAGQVAVTCSLEDPVEDFDVNACGTLTLLEQVRRVEKPPSLVFTSTNKVYGNLGDVELDEQTTRHAPRDPSVRARGISESRPLDLHSPYGCSKGCADQYALDYAQSFGLRAVVFRMSCIYGPRQLGNEDQGWVAHFLRSALEGRPLSIYGDGKQVRDVLFVADLVEAFHLAVQHMDVAQGHAFNIGGGPENTVSLIELLDRIEVLEGRRPHVTFSDWRRGDQRYYVSDTTRFCTMTGWRPSVGIDQGLQLLRRWLHDLCKPGLERTVAAAAGE